MQCKLQNVLIHENVDIVYNICWCTFSPTANLHCETALQRSWKTLLEGVLKNLPLFLKSRISQSAFKENISARK